MTDPTLAMQSAIVTRLKAFAGVAAVVGAQVYDAVPPNVSLPYINLGQPQVLPDKYSCIDGSEVSYPIHGWVVGPQSVVIKQLGKAIIDALDDYDLTVTGHRMVVFELETAQYVDDPDGITKHFIAVFRALTEPA